MTTTQPDRRQTVDVSDRTDEDGAARRDPRTPRRSPPHSEYQIDWISARIEEVERRGVAGVDTTTDAETQWWEQLTAVAGQTLFPQADSWYTGANIEGKTRNFMLWAGGFDTYVDICGGVATNGYPGLVLDGKVN